MMLKDYKWLESQKPQALPSVPTCPQGWGKGGVSPLGPACPTHTRTPTSFKLCPTSTQQTPAHAWCFQGLVIPTLGASANHKSRVCKRRAWASSTFGIHRAKQGRSVHPKAASMGLSQSVTAGREGPPGGRGRGTGAHTLALISLRTVSGRGGGWGEPNQQGHTPGSGQTAPSSGSQQLQETVPGSA